MDILMGRAPSMGNRQKRGGEREAGRRARLAVWIVPAVLAWGESAVPGAVPESAPGAIAVLALPDLEGRPADLASYRGRVILLNFWATWCGPCRDELPVLVDLQTRYGDRGLTVIAASADAPERDPEVRRFVRRHLQDVPVWTGATTQDLERLGLGEALPATTLIDRDGRIAARFIGPFDPALLQAWVEWLLGDRATPAPGPTPVTAPSFPGGAAGHDHDHPHDGEHGEEEGHAHGGVGIEGASLVPY
jgi:thiol-disulfide isomerase/thioredoxin